MTLGTVYVYLSGEAINKCVCVHVHQYACMCVGHLSVCKFESQWSTQAQTHSDTTSLFVVFKSSSLVF